MYILGNKPHWKKTKYFFADKFINIFREKGDFLFSLICFCWHCLNFPAISEISPLTDHVSLPCNEFMGDPNLWELPKFLFGVKVITSSWFQLNNKLFFSLIPVCKRIINTLVGQFCTTIFTGTGPWTHTLNHWPRDTRLEKAQRYIRIWKRWKKHTGMLEYKKSTHVCLLLPCPLVDYWRSPGRRGDLIFNIEGKEGGAHIVIMILQA